MTLTGFTDLDRLTGGLSEGSLTILASPSGVGKSSFVLSLAANILRREPEPVYGADIGMREVRQTVALFSLQSSKDQVFQKLMAIVGHLPLHNVYSGSVGPEDWPQMVRSAYELSRSPLFVNDSAGINLREMRASLQEVKQSLHDTNLDGAKIELGLIVVDHLHLMLSRSGTPAERENKVTNILRDLKILARDLNVPVLVLSQIPGEVRRHDKRPLISDFDPSEPVDEFADMVMFLYRDEFYNPDSGDKGIAEVIVAKHRSGPTGMVQMAFLDLVGGRFVSLARD